jgi:lysophospholipase L1-like esterase
VKTLLPAALLIAGSLDDGPSFKEFDRRAKAGERLSVVFFGASLTWGANASDPLLTSYRARVAQRLESAYPEARFKCWDAAIGGTGSQLGVFRLERDVLGRKPDLVFVDFSANDDINSSDPETLSSYEAIVRRLVEARVPVVQVIFPFLWNVKDGKLEDMKRRTAHLEIAKAYHTAVGDAIELARERIASGETTLEKLWPYDGVHPGDAGYALFADAAWDAFRGAVTGGRVCAAPAKTIHGDTYLKSARVRLSTLGDLPEGWRKGGPNPVAAYFDFLMTRWLEDEVIAGTGASPLTLKFRGSMVLFLGESTTKSAKYRVTIDGKVVEHAEGKQTLQTFDPARLGKAVGGNAHHAQVIATGLDGSVDHTLEIEPLFTGKDQELRLESVCVAGGDPSVRR